MKIGISIPSVVGAPVDTAALAKKAEELGFESIWVPEHTVMPVNPDTPFPYADDGVIQPHYSHMMDPFIALARASGATSKINLGTGVSLLPERNPILLAKTVASLDHFSGGRVLLGIGAGWLREELEIMGGNFPHRWGQAREHVLAMKELWTKDFSEYHGTYYDFPPVRCFPKPARKPHPPVLLGGMAKRVLERVADYGDGWMPNIVSYDEVRAARAKLDQLATERGRDPKSIEISAHGQPANAEAIARHEEAGASRCVVRLAGNSTEEALSNLEEIGKQLL